ncbi:shikimate dehydrogenase [Agromyces mariniharenae]|uniref:Shikimate dehydrogenase n=1 Tax=Agromyces mariniharenae TaxID=2604423 RepID=A0A5S4UW22_9MICO|nr:shikimate dehydrogenase [Agromyces mariniharenae]TYL50776.1 shikimate dehydrogenase [Agromyces mariniharenae]
MASDRRRLAVLGSPIAHSKSPALHRAAYDLLGLDWEYTAIELDGAGLRAFLDTRDASWRGLSLTMPLKQDVLPLLDEVDELATLTNAANTVLLADGVRRGFNTDVGGIVRALGEAGCDRIRHGVLVGGGATAASALAAMAELGAASVQVLLRRPGAGGSVAELGARLGLAVEVRPIADLATLEEADLVVSTLPGGADPGVEASAALRRATLFDVAYAPWPTRLVSQWLEAGGTVVHGLEMLLHQAVLQVRIFASGDPFQALPDEAAVLDVMRRSL